MLRAFRIAYYIGARDDRRSFIGRHNTGQHTQGCSLARAVRSDQAKDLCGTNVEAEVIDGGDSRKALRESFSHDCGLGLREH
jgi:hypothetical protein